jgi:hypothetical protein
MVRQVRLLGSRTLASQGSRPGSARVLSALRHYEHAHLPSNIEKLTLPILGSMLPFPTGGSQLTAV